MAPQTKLDPCHKNTVYTRTVINGRLVVFSEIALDTILKPKDLKKTFSESLQMIASLIPNSITMIEDE